MSRGGASPAPTHQLVASIWADQECTVRPSGVVTEVYCKVDKRFSGYDEIRINDYFRISGPSESYPREEYSISWMTDFFFDVANYEVMPGVYRLEMSSGVDPFMVDGLPLNFYDDGYYGPVPVPIAVQGDVQIFGNNQCTVYATGGERIVYARVNVPWSGIDSGWSIRDTASRLLFAAGSPTTEYPNELYFIMIWDDWLSYDSFVPYTQGQIVTLSNGDPSYEPWPDPPVIFTKP